MSLAHERSSGIYLVAASAVLWSTAGLFVRMADMDMWSMVAWRSAFTFLALGAFFLLRNRFASQRSSMSFGFPGIAGCLVSAIAAITYIASLRWTTVANVMTIYATLPFIVAADRICVLAGSRYLPFRHRWLRGFRRSIDFGWRGSIAPEHARYLCRLHHDHGMCHANRYREALSGHGHHSDDRSCSPDLHLRRAAADAI